MQVTVGSEYLNVRTGLPSLNAPSTSYLSPGDVIEIDGQLYKGDSYQNINTWVKDLAGNHYWSGGFVNGLSDYLKAALTGTALNFPLNYNYFLNQVPSMQNDLGLGVTIAIVDHPISADLKSNIPIDRPLGSNEPEANFHANFIFGLIAGSSDILGVASNVKIVSLPIYDELGFPFDNTGIENVLNFIKQSPEPMIVNISNSFENNFDEILNSFSDNKIIVSSAGVNAQLSGSQIRYPASYKNAIAVGALDVQSNTIQFNNKVNFVLPNFRYVSYNLGLGTYIADSGDSYATAIVSAIIALIIANGNISFNRDDVLKALNSNALSIANVSAFSSLNLLNIKT